MSVQSVLLHFSAESARITNVNSCKYIVQVIKSNVEKHCGKFDTICETSIGDDQLHIWKDNTGIVFTLRLFHGGLITFNMEYFRKTSEQEKITFLVSKTNTGNLSTNQLKSNYLLG